MEHSHPTTTPFPATSSFVTRELHRLASYNPGHSVVTFTTEEGPAPAWYHQKTGDITISLRFLDLVPDEILVDCLNPGVAGVLRSTRDDLIKHYSKLIPGTDKKVGVVLGILQHEVAHSRWSRWVYESYDKIRSATSRPEGVARLIQVWEEVRIEKRAYDADANVRPTLRHSFDYLLELVTQQDPSTKFDVSVLWALTVGRSHAGVVEQDEILEIDDLAKTILDDYTVSVLHEILDEVVDLDIHSIPTSAQLQAVVDLAEEWLDIVEYDETNSGTLVLPTEAVDGDSDGERVDSGDGDGDEADGADADAGGADGGTVDDVDLDADPGTDGVGPKGPGVYREISIEDARRLVKALGESTTKISADASRVPGLRLSDRGQWARKVFGGKSIAKGGAWSARPPDHAERQAVASLATALGQISYDAPAVRKVATHAPPGRMKSREAVRRSADRSAGRMTSARPWESKKRRHSHNPPITLGLMTDTSGSMGWAQNAVASAAYIFANAVPRVSGRFSAVTFGDAAEAVVRPGEIPKDVRTRSADGGTEEFDRAVAALDGVLHLSDGRGARVLVVFSDGGLVKPNEPEKALLWLDCLHRAGVAVVWINRDRAKPRWLPPYVEYVNGSATATAESGFKTVVQPIANAVERAFRSART